ncbi:MAG TPA: hypothetical protein VKX25_18660 [Bryobacteraceae bacterium]|jgi:ubiquitin-protein ligase|nr:hypothetical protein [Bryobacteraceae bacterium]
MSSSVRARRIENEWQYLLLLARENPSILEIRSRRSEPTAECFDFSLARTPAYAGPQLTENIRDTHELTLRLPEFYPAVPCEAYLRAPLFHPNIHPLNGFICLWDRFSVGDSVIEAVRQIQLVISWHLFNSAAEHLMQPEALASAAERKPLPYQPVLVPESLALERSYCGKPATPRRSRLSCWSEPQPSPAASEQVLERTGIFRERSS